MSSVEHIRNTCVLCGASSFKRLFGRNHFLIKCRNCGMVSARMIPTEEELKAYYLEYPSYDSISPLTLQRYNEILDKLEPYRKSNSLLETGCGFGFFLEAARMRKWQVTGTELSGNALAECRRKNIPVSEHLEDLIRENKIFDAVVSLEVIEHLKDPVEQVSKYARLLRPSGVLYVTTPNFNSFSRRLLGRKWNVILYPEHIHYFTPDTIHRMLKDEFLKIENQTSGISPARIISTFRSHKPRKGKDLENYDFNEVDRQLRDNIEKTVLLRLIKRLINSLLAALKSGDSLKILYQKKA
jgi:2-polyprenyl-3-methyl-5-hydroxy-6-metoxy-1,4-benzoquinol methylase